MPVYSYQCDNCGVRFERTQKFADRPVTRCPECHKNRVRKLLTPPGIVFKGSGWYATDHRSASGANKPGKKSDGSSDGKTEGSSEKTSEKTEKTEKSETKSSSSDDK